MAERGRFLERVKGGSEAERLWLQTLWDFVVGHLGPPESPAPSVLDLALDLVRILQESSASGSLPVSYRLVSVSDLVSLQRVPCVSCLSWTTNRHREWVREAEQIPGLRPLPRVKLLLIGRLCRGRDPDLKLTDSTGELHLQSQVPLWSLSPDQAVFLPHWNYIPHDAPGHGLLELVAPPIPLGSASPRRGADGGTEGAGLRTALSVNQAATLLLQHQTRGRGAGGRGLRGGCVSVRGVVSAVCPLLDIGGTTFFIFSLMQSHAQVHVVVKDGSCRLWWSAGVHVGMSVHVTELRACTLQSWSGNSVLSATDQSELTIIQQPAQPQTGQSEPAQPQTGQSEPAQPQTGQSEPSVQQMDQSQLCFEEAETVEHSEAETEDDQSEPRRPSVINYQGMVTDVLSRGAGLYVIDRKVGLCLANQPPPKRHIRPGDVLQVSNVHVLLRPSPDHSPIMLCCCLRSGVTVTAFSPGYRRDEEAERCPGDGVLPRLLLEKDVGVAEYLWMCHVTTHLRNKFHCGRRFHTFAMSPLKRTGWRSFPCDRRRGNCS